MDPITLALLISGGLAAGQGIAGTFQNNGPQKDNREKLAELQKREDAGTLGLTPGQQQEMSNALLSPIQRGATQMLTRGEQAQAASGNDSGAQLARLREERDRTIAGAQQSAAQQILGANNVAQQQQRNEIEQRLAAKSAMRADDLNGLFSAASQLAGPIGALAGAAPGTGQAAGMFGGGGARPAQVTPPTATASKVLPGLTYEETQALARYYQANPDHLPPELAGTIGQYLGTMGGL